jgi:hypothetical protein
MHIREKRDRVTAHSLRIFSTLLLGKSKQCGYMQTRERCQVAPMAPICHHGHSLGMCGGKGDAKIGKKTRILCRTLTNIEIKEDIFPD